MTTTTDPRQQRAQDLLDAHDKLRAANDAEPPDAEDGTAAQAAAWMRWYDTWYCPRQEQWKAALAAFRQVQPWTGEGTGAHPWTFRPECRALLGQPVVYLDRAQ